MESFVEVDLECVHMTGSAALMSDGDREVWIPLSVFDEPPEQVGDARTFEIAEWFAHREGLI